jgi:hypothetical protein
MYFEDSIDEAKYCGHLFGLGSSLFQNGIPPYDSYNIGSQTLVAVAQSVASQHQLSIQQQTQNNTSTSNANSSNGTNESK